MATKYLGRWSATDVSGVRTTRIGPSSGALVRQIGEPPARRKPVQYVHVHVPRTRDQGQGSTPQPLGAGGSEYPGEGVRLTGQDRDGRNWSATIFGPDGNFENVEGGQAVHSTVSVPPVEDTLDGLRRRFGPQAHDGRISSVEQGNRMAAMQAYFDKFWAPR